MITKNVDYEITITGLTHEGHGVGGVNGFTVFVAGALPGETGIVKIIKVAKNYGIGKLISIIKESPVRIKPWCPVFSRCGGCNLQHISYEAQLDYKAKQVAENIRRIGKLENIIVNPTLGMENPFSYRNKVQYPVQCEKGEIRIGFYADRTHEVVECADCGIQTKESNHIMAVIKDFVTRHHISVYDEGTGKGLLRHVVIRTGFHSRELMVVLVINGRKFPDIDKMIAHLKHEVSEITSIFININRENTNVILGKESNLMFGKEVIIDDIGGYHFEISPLSFFQVNPRQTEVLYKIALEYAGLTGVETVMDLYCGIGTISLFLSQKAKKVIGVEVVEAAVVDARKNADLNGVKNVAFFAGEAEVIVPKLYEQGICADVVVVDPPRKGCDEALLHTMVQMQPSRIVYVSCDSATLARDLGYLCGKGYEVKEVQPVDMFPWTRHVESIALLQMI